jgi:probable rRNA maturation factor
MNRVDVAAAEVPLPAWTPKAEEFVLAALERLEKSNWDVSVIFCDDSFIRNLNSRFRKKDEPTDVLSFPAEETIEEDGEERYLAGDIIISLETVPRNAREFGTTLDEEMKRLLLHGVLHLAGHDHEHELTDEDAMRDPMLALQEKILGEFAGKEVVCGED